mmetsp:Transcript_34144/g.61564  ORF Transcript_34144/g.61564 Transcript_34144/m.61564 type:complete len:229 (+) Transcript_34144:702-1388(+)
MIEDPTKNQQTSKGCGTHLAANRGIGSLPLGRLHVNSRGDAVNERNNGNKTEKIDAIEIFVLSKTFFGKDVADDHANVRNHGVIEARPSKGNLLHGGKRAAAHNGEERGPNIPGVPVAKERAREEYGEDGLGRFNNVSETDCDLTEADAGRDMADSVEETNGKESQEQLAINARSLLETEGPHNDHEKTTSNQLPGRNKPGAGEIIQSRLVYDIEDDVEGVPKKEIKR